jgi:starch synthase
MPIPLAIVHHANQYLITEGYENRQGIHATLGSIENKTGLAWILELHRAYRIPANFHFSGTLLEAIAWHQPEFLLQIRSLYQQGLIELVGSSYAQNIMRFFDDHHNLKQLNEELRLFQIHLDVDPTEVKTFWPPERVWDTEKMAPIVTDSCLINGGYKYVLLDDRVFLPVDGDLTPRYMYDLEQWWDPQLFRTYEVEQGRGLVALPISYHLRQTIPPDGDQQWAQLRNQLQWLATLADSSVAADVIAVYGDDMEKAAGLGNWNHGGPAQYEAFLGWLKENPWIQPVQVTKCCSSMRVAGLRSMQIGTFIELANHSAAGEGYERWYFDPQWEPYRRCFSWAEGRVDELSRSGSDPTLVELAEKHLLASSWETAWHTPRGGPFGNAEAFGHPSPWTKAVASHSRHSAVIAEAANWMRRKDGAAHAYLDDLDSDSEEELILKNDKLFAVLSPRWGGRLVALFSVEEPDGKMVIGNPSDDWNWSEELNRYMEVPPNHPGALSDVGFEHDRYSIHIVTSDGEIACSELCNHQPLSKACGLKKRISLARDGCALRIEYTLPPELHNLDVDFGLSPDYLRLLRYGRNVLEEFVQGEARGWRTGRTAVWVRPEDCAAVVWAQPPHSIVGHACMIRLSLAAPQFAISIGVQRR